MFPAIKKRHALVLLIATAQAVCLCIGTLVFDGWVRNSMRKVVHEQVLADNIHSVQQMTALIRQMDVANLRRDQKSWSRLQSVVHEIQLGSSVW